MISRFSDGLFDLRMMTPALKGRGPSLSPRPVLERPSATVLFLSVREYHQPTPRNSRCYLHGSVSLRWDEMGGPATSLPEWLKVRHAWTSLQVDMSGQALSGIKARSQCETCSLRFSAFHQLKDMGKGDPKSIRPVPPGHTLARSCRGAGHDLASCAYN